MEHILYLALSLVPRLHPEQDKLVLCGGSEQGSCAGKESSVHGNNSTRVRLPPAKGCSVKRKGMNGQP